MSLLFRSKRTSISDHWGPERRGRSGGAYVGRKQAFAHSAFWAAVRLRADLISTLPVDVYRKVGSIQVAVPTPPVLVAPGGDRVDICEWMYSSQVDLDTVGNSFGLITERDGAGLPRRIDLVPRDDVTVQVRNGKVGYLIAGESYHGEKAVDVWHERQYTTSGIAVGLSPLAYAAMSLAQFGSAQEFATAWFAGGAIPTGVLQYQDRGKLDPIEVDGAKARFRLAVENRDLFVTGNDWDYKVIEAQASQTSFLETMDITDVAIARFLGVPGDMIDAAAKGSSITYANITQRNLQLLIMNLGPAVTRRERSLSRLLPSPRFVKLNTDAMIRMDPETVAKVLGQEVRDRLRTPTEAREKLNLQPYTPEQLDEFAQLFPTRAPEPAKSGA